MADEKTRAVFFDRDGTIMHDVNYCSDPKDVHVFPFVADSLRKLKARAFKLIMVTNQSGIGRGYFTWEQYERVHAEVLRQLGKPLIDATYVCPDVPGSDSKCRKPAPGMILQGAREHGIKAIRVRTGFETNTADSSADWIAQDFAEATEIILTKFEPA
jgi:D-glycero-D-manno-heptose 1,7-bisphosphate phosphatase